MLADFYKTRSTRPGRVWKTLPSTRVALPGKTAGKYGSFSHVFIQLCRYCTEKRQSRSKLSIAQVPTDVCNNSAVSTVWGQPKSCYILRQVTFTSIRLFVFHICTGWLDRMTISMLVPNAASIGAAPAQDSGRKKCT